MKIERIIETPIDYFPYLNVSGGKRREVITRVLPIRLGYASNMPDELDALIICADLQGNIQTQRGIELLGEHLPYKLVEMLPDLEGNPLPKRTGVFLCGDLHAQLDKRGGLGDVREVWLTFRDFFAWTAGVAGNHDEFGSQEEFRSFKKASNIHYLDGEVKEINGLKVAGVGGIIGDERKHFRKSELRYTDMMLDCLAEEPDFLLLHESPAVEGEGLIGNLSLGETLEELSAAVTVCSGHCHWRDTHLFEMKNGTRILNADAKAFIILPEQED